MVRPALRRNPLMPLAGLGIVLIATIAAILLSQSVARSSGWVAHAVRTQVIITELDERRASYESAVRGFLIHGDRPLLGDAAEARRGIDARLRLLDHELADNPIQVARLALLRRLINERLRYLEARIEEYARTGKVDFAVSNYASPAARPLSIRIHAQLAAMFATEADIMEQRQLRTQRLATGLSIGLAGAVLLVVLVAYITIGDARRRHSETIAAHMQARADAQARAEAESQLQQFQKMESIGQLSGGVAHDLNNMLAVIIGSLDMARRGSDDPKRMATFVANALDGADRAATLVQRLLAFSRRQPLAPAILDPNAVATAAIGLLRRSLGTHITIETALVPGVWPIRADPGQLETAILNLAVNARDAMEGGGKLTLVTANRTLEAADLRAHPDVAPGDYAMIAVCDEGAGMSADVRARAFEPFFTTKAVGKGTGLGLSQVFGFVKQSGGHVELEPGESCGTIVRLFLPRSTEGVPTPPLSATPRAAEGGQGERILVVEDDERVRELSMEALTDLGYQPIGVASGAAALELLTHEPLPDLLFTDVVMPGIGGQELVRTVRAAHPGMRILFTTGYARNQPVGEEGLDPTIGVLAKPFTVGQLAAHVRDALDG